MVVSSPSVVPRMLTLARSLSHSHRAMQQLEARFDKQLGGFGGAPKFPTPSQINALLMQQQLLRVRVPGGG